MNNSIEVKNNNIVMPAVDAKGAVEAWKKYEALKVAIIDKDNDVQRIGDKDFLKKSYWRKLGTFFNLSIEVIDERHESIGKTVVWHFTVKATADNGRSAIGTGSCDAFEKATLREGKYMTEKVVKWKKLANGRSVPDEKVWVDATPNSIHNIRSTAETRATNRAISNLVGGGEVSAEEVEQGHADMPEQAQEPKKEEPKITEFQMKKIFAIGAEVFDKPDEVKKFAKDMFKVEHMNDLTLAQANKVVDALEAKVKEGEKNG